MSIMIYWVLTIFTPASVRIMIAGLPWSKIDWNLSIQLYQ